MPETYQFSFLAEKLNILPFIFVAVKIAGVVGLIFVKK